VVEHEGLRLDCERMSATFNSAPLELSRREFLLLRTLLSRPGKVYSRSQLEAALYDGEHEVSSNAIEVHVHNLRRKTGPGLIQTVRGVGYRAGASR
jgi:two-component system response regulator QseB